MLRCVALVRTDVSEERNASIISVLRFLFTAKVVPNGIPHSHRRENLKSYNYYILPMFSTTVQIIRMSTTSI
jgi:hypothetical protein